MNLYALHPRVFTRGHTRKVNTEKLLAACADRNIQLILNVAIIDDPILEAACRTVGITYRHEPLNDSGKKLIPSRVEQLSDDVADAMQYHGVLIHCDSGWNRSALIALLAIHKVTKRPPAELVAEARQVRGEDLLKNWAFEVYVMKHEVPM